MNKIIINLCLIIINLFFRSFDTRCQTYAGVYDTTIHYRLLFAPPLHISYNDSECFDSNNDGIVDFEIKTSVGELTLHGWGQASYIRGVEGGSFSIGTNNGSSVEPYEFVHGDSLNKHDTSLIFRSCNGPYTSMTIAISIPSYNVDYDTWLNNPNYMGFTIENYNRDTLFGWIKANLIDYDKIYLHEIVCESLNPGTRVVNLINNNHYESSILLFPNPASEILFLEYEQSLRVNKIQIFNIDGELIIERVKDIDSLNISGLRDGIYLIVIKNIYDQILLRKKIVKY